MTIFPNKYSQAMKERNQEHAIKDALHEQSDDLRSVQREALDRHGGD